MKGTPVTLMAVRLRPLQSNHWITHSRVLIGLEPRDSSRRKQRVELLREQPSRVSANRPSGRCSNPIIREERIRYAKNETQEAIQSGEGA
jgi:hypothetical protein